jgi:hypothetical protein
MANNYTPEQLLLVSGISKSTDVQQTQEPAPQQSVQEPSEPSVPVTPYQPPIQEPTIVQQPEIIETEENVSIIPQSVEQRETQITTAIAEQDAGRQAIQKAIAMGLMSQSALQEFEQSLKDITLKKEDITRLREEISDYERYLTELEDAANEGGFTLAGEDLTPELVEQKRQEYKEYLDKRVQTTVALTSPFSDLTTGKSSLASAISVGASQEQINALAQTISNNMPESTRVEPERLIELTKTFDDYRKGEDYNIGKVISETVNGNLNRQDVQDYFGKDTIDKVDISVKLQNYKIGEEYNLEAIMDGLERGAVNRSDVETLFGKDTLNFIRNYNEQVETIQKETRNVIANEVSNKGFDLKDINEPTFTEIEGLIRSGVDPINLVAAGYNVNDINIAVAVINQEAQEWQNARDKLANAGFALPLQQLTESYQDTLPFMVTPSGKAFSIQSLAEWQRENEGDTKTLETYFGKDFVNDVEKYNDYLSEATNEINSYINTPEKIGLKSQGIALDTAITELYEGVKAPGIEVKFIGGNNVFYDVETGESLSEKEVLEKRWEQLTPAQREEVALAFANDPNKYNLFAATNQIFKLASEKGGTISAVALGTITNITNPIAKQMTLGEAKEIINREYESEREILKDYIKQDGTFDINKLTRETGTDYEYRNQLLSDIGYDDIDVLKQNLEYYNNSVKVTGGEIALAGAQVAADVANLLTLGGSGLLASWAGKGLYFGLMTGSGGLMLAAGMPTLTSENASALEKGLAVGIPILLISGGVIGMLPRLGGTTSQIGKVNVKVAQPKITPLERIGNALDNTAYKISKFIADESTRTVKAPNIALPNVIKMVKDASGRINYELVGLGKQSALAAEKAVQEIVEQALKAKVYLKSGLKQEVIEALSNNLTQAKIAKGLAKYVAEEIKVGITKGVQFTDDMIERAIVKGIVAKNYVLEGLSKDIGKAIADNAQYVKYLAKEIGRNVNARYNALMDDLMVKGITVNNQVMDVLSTKVFPELREIPGIVARKAELAKYAYGVVKDDIVKIANMTQEEAEKFINNQMINYIKAKDATLDVLSTDISGAIGYMSKEVVRNIKQNYARIEELRQEVLSTLIEDSFKAVDYLKYGLKEDIVASVNRNKKIAQYLVDRTKSGIERGTIDAYSSANFKTILAELDDAFSSGSKEIITKVAEKLVALGDDAPRYNGINLAQLGRDIIDGVDNAYYSIPEAQRVALSGQQLVDKIAEAYGLESKSVKNMGLWEKFIKRRGTEGYYNTLSDDVTLRNMDDAGVILHELSHPKIIENITPEIADKLSIAGNLPENSIVYDKIYGLSFTDDLGKGIETGFNELATIEYVKRISGYEDIGYRNWNLYKLQELGRKYGIDSLDVKVKLVADRFASKLAPNKVYDIQRIVTKGSVIGKVAPISQRTERTISDIQNWLNQMKKLEDVKTSKVKVNLDAVKEKYLKDTKQRIVEFADEVVDDFLKSRELTPEQIAQGKQRVIDLVRQEKLNALRDKYLQQTKQRIVEYADEVANLYDESRKLTPEQIAQGKQRIVELIRQEKLNALKNQYLKDSQQRIVEFADDIVDNYVNIEKLTPEQIAKRVEDLKTKIIDEKLNILKEKYIQNANNKIVDYADEVLDLYDDARNLTPEDIAKRLDDLKARTRAEKLRLLKETYSTQRESYLKELNEILDNYGDDLDKLGIAPDDVESLRKLIEKVESEKATITQKQAYQKELEGLLDDLGDKLDDLDEAVKNNPDITPDEMDDIVRGDKGGGTAVKEKTEVKTETKPETKTKTAEELDELFKEKTKPEVKTETKPSTKTQVSTGVIAPVTVIKSTFIDEELTPSEEIPSEKPPEIEPMVSPMKPSIIPIIKPVTPMPEIRDIPSIQIAPITGDEISEEVETFREVQPLKEPERLPETLGSEMFSVSPEEVQEPSEMPYPEPLKQPQPEAVEYPTPVTEETPYPELFVRPVTETPIPPDVPVKTPVKPISPIPLPELELEEGEKQGKVYKPGTVVFIQGRPNGGAMFKVFEPPMYEMETVREVPQGYVDEGWEGEGLSQKSLQVIGGMPDHDIRNLDLGVFRINILNENGQPKIEYLQDSDANSGSRSETIGMGKGQIPIEVWKDAKERGISRKELAKGLNEPYEKLENRLTKKVVEEVEEPPMRKPSNVSNWWEEESEMPVKMNEKLYRGRRILPPQIGG